MNPAIQKLVQQRGKSIAASPISYSSAMETSFGLSAPLAVATFPWPSGQPGIPPPLSAHLSAHLQTFGSSEGTDRWHARTRLPRSV